MQVKTLSELKPGTLPVIPARFQVDALHCEHIRLIEEAMASNNGQVLIVLGINLVGSTRRNPLDYYSRMMMIREHFPSPSVAIIGHRDMPRDNQGWSDELDKKVSDHLMIGQEAVMCGSRDSFQKHYKGRHHKWEMKSKSNVNGTKIRASITGPLPTEAYQDEVSYRNYRRGIIAARNNSYNLHPTAVDTLVWNKLNNMILLCMKPGQDQWRFSGGFCDGHTTYEQDGIRESMEEMGVVVRNPKIISSHVVDDYRYLFEDENIISILQVAEFNSGIAKPLDDLEGGRVRWFDLGYFEWKKGSAPMYSKYNLEDIRPLHREMMIEALDWIKYQQQLKKG